MQTPVRAQTARLDEVVAPEREATDRQIVARIRAGDEQAFDALAMEYIRPLRAYIKSLVDSRATAEELVQDVFLNIRRIRERWEVRSSLRSYLFQAAHNVAIAQRRRVRANERWEQQVSARGEVPMMGTLAMPADRQAEATELSDALRRAIDGLPPRCRQAAMLRLVHDLSYAETARIMGVTVKAVERHATRALQAIRADMAPYFRQ